jgi:hypothetical protein
MKVGTKAVAEARVYYELKDRTRELQLNCQKTVLAYERACQMLFQAKEEIEVTEKKFKNQSKEDRPDFDVTCQEMLNHATIKLQEAEKLKKKSKANHEQSMREFLAAEEDIAVLERKLKTHIKKSKPYFEESAKFKASLARIKREIEMLNEQIVASKSYYAVTLKDLEAISEEIHYRRNSRLITFGLRREPGVGAEKISLDDQSDQVSVDETDDIDYKEIVPELNLNVSRFQLEVRPDQGAVFETGHPPSSDISTADTTSDAFNSCDSNEIEQSVDQSTCAAEDENDEDNVQFLTQLREDFVEVALD